MCLPKLNFREFFKYFWNFNIRLNYEIKLKCISVKPAPYKKNEKMSVVNHQLIGRSIYNSVIEQKKVCTKIYTP